VIGFPCVERPELEASHAHLVFKFKNGRIFAFVVPCVVLACCSKALVISPNHCMMRYMQ